jgi:hypothetical protein
LLPLVLLIVLLLVYFSQEEAKDVLLEFIIGLLPDKSIRADLGQKSTPEFCKVFVMSIKLTDFTKVKVSILEG